MRVPIHCTYCGKELDPVTENHECNDRTEFTELSFLEGVSKELKERYPVPSPSGQKLFTLEDMLKAIQYGKTIDPNDNLLYGKEYTEFMDSLTPKQLSAVPSIEAGLKQKYADYLGFKTFDEIPPNNRHGFEWAIKNMNL